MNIILQLPPYIARQEIENYFPGIITRKYLANLASQGRGPRYLKLGRKVVYRTQEFIAWLEENGIEVATIDQGAMRP
ncbi:MAG: hypothetical protein ABIJ56_17985 [Pseudomonadota bacterium]